MPSEQIFDIAEAQAEPVVALACLAKELSRETVSQ